MTKSELDIAGDSDALREGPARFAAFASRAARLLAPYSTQARYLAFSSDVGEAARPVAHPKLVRASYAISWLYVFGDVAAESYHQSRKTPSDNARIADKALRTAVFQLLASIALPFLIIHKGVHLSSKLLKRAAPPQYVNLHKWGPSGAGLAMIPALPVLVDHPVEYLVDKSFNKFDPFNVNKCSNQTDPIEKEVD